MFQATKEHLSSPCLLVRFDPQKELTLAYDASPYRVRRCSSLTLHGAWVPQPVAIIAIGEGANNLAISKSHSWPSRISRVYDGA